MRNSEGGLVVCKSTEKAGPYTRETNHIVDNKSDWLRNKVVKHQTDKEKDIHQNCADKYLVEYKNGRLLFPKLYGQFNLQTGLI